MTWSLIEGLIVAVKTRLAANLDAKLTALNAEYADGITLGPMVTRDSAMVIHLAPRSLESIQQFPIAFIIGGPTDVEYWNNTNTNGTHEITVAIMDRDQDEEVLQKKIYRYERALWECLVDGHFAAGLSGFRLVGSPRLDSSPILTAQSLSLGEARVTVNAVKQETRTP